MQRYQQNILAPTLSGPLQTTPVMALTAILTSHPTKVRVSGGKEQGEEVRRETQETLPSSELPGPM